MLFVKFFTQSAKHQFSTDSILKYFLIFSRKQDLTFHANCLQLSLFPGENKKNIINMLSAFSADNILKYFSISPSKQDLTFQANYLQHRQFA